VDNQPTSDPDRKLKEASLTAPKEMKAQAPSLINPSPEPGPPQVVATLPINEPQRLQALQQYNVLDTLPEPEFDDITNLASYICGTPMALISLFDQERQWFKSKVGLDATCSSRDIAFCAHAILQPDLFIVPDALLDERFKDNPFVVGEPKIRFYAGAPLLTSRGHALGTLCIIDRIPRELTPQQKGALRSLSRQVVALLELRRASVELEEAQSNMADFNAMIVHDIRSPLTVVASASAMLQEDSVGPLNERQKLCVNRIESKCHQLLYLVKDFLDLAKLEASTVKVEKQEINLRTLVEEAIDDFRVLMQKKNLCIQNHMSPGAESIIADPYRLAQVLSNLIGNAVKFTSDYGTIEVGAEVRSGGESKIWVKDTGIGIPSHAINGLFKKYQSASREQTPGIEGSGLGLMICKNIVEAHGGKIWVESQERVGTTFFFTLPAAVQS